MHKAGERTRQPPQKPKTSVPTPVGPKNMKLAIGRLGWFRPARLIRTASLTALMARSWHKKQTINISCGRQLRLLPRESQGVLTKKIVVVRVLGPRWDGDILLVYVWVPNTPIAMFDNSTHPHFSVETMALRTEI